MNRIQSILNKSAVNNAIWLYLCQIVNTILPLVTLPYITRVLGAAGYGILALAINIIGYLQVIVEYGFDLSATRLIASSKNPLEEIEKRLFPIILSRFTLWITSFLVMILYFFVANSKYEEMVCISIMFGGLLGICFQTNWAFQGIQKMKIPSVINMIARVFSTLLIFLLVKSEKDVFVYAFLYSLPPILVGIISVIVLKIGFGIGFSKITIRNVIDEIKEGWLVFTTSFNAKVLGTIGVTLLSVYVSHYELGIYSAIQKIPNILLLIWMPISQILYPISSSKWAVSEADGKKFVKKMAMYCLLLFSLFASLIAVGAKIIIRLYLGSEYEPFYYWIYPLLVWVIISILNNFLGVQSLLARGKDSDYSKVFNIGVIFTLIINWICIYIGKGMGAAIAPAMAETVLSILLILRLKKIH